MKFDRTILRWIAKNDADLNPVSTPVSNLMLPAQGYAVAIVQPGEDCSDLYAAMEEVSPGARVNWITPVDGATGDDMHLAFINQLLTSAGEGHTDLEHLEQVETGLAGLLYPRMDFLVVEHAERLSIDSLHALRRYHSMPPTVLIAYSERFLETLSRDLLLIRNAYFFNQGS